VSTARRRGGPAELAPYLALAGLTLLLVLVGGVWVACALAHQLTGSPAPPANPFQLVLYLVFGKQDWPGTAATAIALAELLLLVGLALVAWLATSRWRQARTRVDPAARHLASTRDIADFTERGAAQVAQRLGARTTTPGVRVGRPVGTAQILHGTWEQTHVDIWGTRTGKTTSRAIPATLDAPGAAVVTSNKRDIVDATRGPRQRRGEVWIFDPQNVAGASSAWWWNPLSYVVDVDKAARMAAVFSAYSRDPGAKTDSYFDPEGEALLGFLLLAAAEAGEPITTVYRWASDPMDATPVDALRLAGHELPAEAVQGVINMPDKQRGGIYGTAKKSVNCLVNPAITRWVTPPKDGADALPLFHPKQFARSTDTLYSLSREGQGTAGPLVTALTVAVIEAAEEEATRSPGGRLPVPFLAVLDEAANVCKWRDLPNLYSHYGARGIVLMTILQSWAQGQETWGEYGMKKLWDAANIRVYGGGSTDDKFLGGLAELVGYYEMNTISSSVQAGSRGAGRSRTTSTSTRRERIMDVADLAALPRGRAIVFPSGAPPVLIETLPWHRGPHAEAVKASLAAHAPADELPHHELPADPADDNQPG
jgi:type IV secretory pathway TraG/TraD family ATPase VirD4